MNLRKKLKLYVITDRRLRPEVESVKEALEGGATSIQLRIKNASTREMIEIGKEIRKLTEEYDALYFVDDRLDVALATNADGVQLGSEDMPISIAKEIAPNLIIGASVYSLEEALQAEKEGADYLGAGSVFPTPTKKDVKIIGIDGLKRIVESVKIPVVAIGGINHENVREVLKAGVDGIAVISAIMGAENVREATERMRKIIEEVIR
ncbi:thiamine phosphate synthase [Thermococcus alcaliphilus]|uniref:thiamine phosphate synthase n=1 Tax=Thermococcus alcaliphilus TaxID=139207 RepID=UPI002090EE3B|nr:thiamine phosphate synthase [Thermococcus alcaliphilus]MCO6041905.1 thiamine phosphate synthase [Thermococcus alcaliphilus]